MWATPEGQHYQGVLTGNTGTCVCWRGRAGIWGLKNGGRHFSSNQYFSITSFSPYLPRFLFPTLPVKSDLCDASVESVSGYFNITGTRDAAYFYWLFESRGDPSTDPLVVWLTGGPVGGEGGSEGGREEGAGVG